MKYKQLIVDIWLIIEKNKKWINIKKIIMIILKDLKSNIKLLAIINNNHNHKQWNKAIIMITDLKEEERVMINNIPYILLTVKK